ncbi:hypothetical protein Tco_0878057 [Tanacetum coccineum]|uniref:Uncharacterized protein n=1 Tax=Tanacetum coccineum TaxID=301880 RepID=A0ABQ5BZK8_9ASTR
MEESTRLQSVELEVIINGDSPLPKRIVNGVEQTYPPTTAEEKLVRNNDLKARELKTHNLIWRNKPDLDTLSMDDLYNNLKIYETEVKGSSSSNQNSQNVAFVSLITLAVPIKLVVLRLVYKAMCRAPRENRNREPVRRNVTVETTDAKALVAQDGFGYDWSDQAKEGPTNFVLMAYTYSSSSSSDTEILKLDIMLRDNALTELRKKFEKAKKERDDLKLTLEKFENSSKNLSKLLDSQVSDKFKTGVGYDSQVFDSQVFDSQMNDKYKSGKGYHAVPPPYIGNFMPPKPDLVLADKDDYVFSESISDSENENEIEFKSRQRKPSNAKVKFVKSNEHVKSPRESVKKVENYKQAEYPRKNCQSPRAVYFEVWSRLMLDGSLPTRKGIGVSTGAKQEQHWGSGFGYETEFELQRWSLSVLPLICRRHRVLCHLGVLTWFCMFSTLHHWCGISIKNLFLTHRVSEEQLFIDEIVLIICMRDLKKRKNQEVEFDLRPSEWLESFDNDISSPTSHTTLVQRCYGAEVSLVLFYRELMPETMSLSSAIHQRGLLGGRRCIILATTALFLD